MNTDSDSSTPSYPLADLCVLAGPATAHYPLLRPDGFGRSPAGRDLRRALCGALHLEQLLLIKKWTAAGLSLERIRGLLHSEQAPVPPRARAVGSVERCCSTLVVADGVDLVIERARGPVTRAGAPVHQGCDGGLYAEVSGEDGRQRPRHRTNH